MVTAYLELPHPKLALDLRWMGLPDDLAAREGERVAAALEDLIAVEAGMIANPDEGREVGHYWLRAPRLAKTVEHTRAILDVVRRLERFVEVDLADRFGTVIVIGIGGSALGPQLVAESLGGAGDRRRVLFVDNTDPEGVARTLADATLADTLALVISKSGRTPETRNGYLLVREAYEAAGLDFGRHAIAVTGAGSELDAEAEGWLARFPMWNWVGGRTSVTSAVGLLPMRLQGLDTEGFLEGAREMDVHTRQEDVDANPAMLLALAWLHATGGRAQRAMVVLPYKDRLLLLSRYLQQLVMESLGKRLDRRGRVVHQGLTVYGNKGSTDQHAFVQQLRDGPDDFFCAFIEVLEDGGSALEVGPGVTAGDYLSGLLAGTRAALAEAGRRSLTLTIPRVDALHLGGLIALFERAVGFYASFVDINAYDQPGVEAGKKAAGALLALQARAVAALAAGASGTAEALAAELGADARDVFHVLRHLAANGRVAASGSGLERVFSAA